MDAKNIQALLTEADGFYSAHSDVMNLVCGLAAALKASEERARKAEELAAANLAANKRIVALEHERDAARAELARLTTPRPIVEAPTDKPVLGIWIDHRGNKCFEVLRWGGRWKGALGTPLYREAEYLPLPEVKP